MKPPPALQPEPSGAPRLRGWLTWLLLIIGVAAWLTVGRAYENFPDQVAPLMTAGATALLLLVPTVRKVAVDGLRSAQQKLQNHIGRSALIIALLSAAYFTFTAIRQDRYLHPHWHDELSYVIQMRMLAEGRLWMTVHPMADFFETFYLVTDRVYASIYFPGTALLYVTETWLRLPLITLPLCAAAACVGLTYWILAKLTDPLAALVGALLMLAISIVRLMSIMVMSNVPVLLMGLLLIFSFIHWQQDRKLRWAIAMGIFAGWAAVSRPLEATCFAVPVGIGIFLRLREWNWKPRLATIALVLAGAAPFLALQLVMNHHITGHWRTPAWQYYSNRDFPQTTMGFSKFDPAIRPVSKLPQKNDMYNIFVRAVVDAHEPHNLPRLWLTHRGPTVVAGTMPYSILLIFLPLGIPLCNTRLRAVVAGVLPVFIVLYTISVVFQIYYPIVVIPSALLLVLLGINAISARAPLIRSALLLWAALMAISALPETGRNVTDQLFDPKLMRLVDDWERNYKGSRALVLFRYVPGRNLDEEPVFNATTAWPDNARIIRANDLGPQNRKLFEYYAKFQPDREVFLFDEGTETYRRLGTIAELAR